LPAGGGTGAKLAAALAEQARETAGLQRALAGVEGGLPALRQERDRHAAALRQAAALVATAARLEALAEIARVEGTLAGLPDAADEALDAVALALFGKADAEAPLFRPESVAEQLARELTVAGG
jgi:hypothetical protein